MGRKLDRAAPNRSRRRRAVDAGTGLDWIAEGLRPLAVPIGDLIPDPQNARTHDEANLAAIGASLRAYGQLKPLVANRLTGQLLAGHGCYLQALELGWTHLAVVWAELDESAARGFSIADNRTTDLSGWDDALLLQQIDAIEGELPDLAIALQLSEFSAGKPKTELRPLQLKAPPAMTWALIGISTVRFGEIAERIDGLATVPGIILETTSNDGPKER